jgi:5-methylcytosine-specific restriction endonuclease McrA
MPKKLTRDKVLRYQKGRRSQATVKKYYLEWRAVQDPPIPTRCDNPECCFFTEPLLWNGKQLKLVLDHINGARGDNRPKNLRFLCPNCNSQQETHGGGNKNRVEESEGGFAIKREDGKRDYTLPVEAGHIKVTSGEDEVPPKTKE